MGSLGEGMSIYFIMKTTKYHFMKITMSTFCSGIVEEKKGIEQRHLHDSCIHTQIQEGTANLFLITSTVICVYSCIYKFYIRTTSLKSPPNYVPV